LTRLLATFALGRVAMGQGDTHLMVAIGATLGAGAVVAVFFIAPFFGLVIGLWKWLRKGSRELPYGPYLSLAAASMVILYRYIEEWFGPGLQAIWISMVGR
jgi:leader peptidase (prepilin peptidase)/N-methyltransferase